MKAEVSVLSPRVAFLDHQRLVLNVDNSVLKQRIAALAQDKLFKDGKYFFYYFQKKKKKTINLYDSNLALERFFRLVIIRVFWYCKNANPNSLPYNYYVCISYVTI